MCNIGLIWIEFWEVKNFYIYLTNFIQIVYDLIKKT